MGSAPPSEQPGVIVVGAGFSGIYALYRFRQLGLKIQGFEAGSDIGGVWYWNRYPGARVDSEYPFYQLNQPRVWRDFNFTERFPDHTEIRSYLQHAAKVLDVKRDILFNATVNSARWSEQDKRWTVRTSAGHTATARYLLLCTGLLYKPNRPDFPGLDRFQGEVHHSAFWKEDLDLSGRRVCVIGAGATGVQIIQSLAKTAGHLTSLVRRPSYCVPMRNRKLGLDEQAAWRPALPWMMRTARRQSKTGFLAARCPDDDGSFTSIWAVPEAERTRFYESLWEAGGFSFQTCNYPEVITDLKANRIAYDFWAGKVRERIRDPRKRDILAPLEPPYPIGTRRAPLETDYYDVVNQDNVDIVDLKATPIQTFTETGVVFEGGQVVEFDHLVLATGFESFSGSLAQMGLLSKDGKDIKDIWAEDGIRSYLGLAIHGFPNLFMCYSPHSPTTLSNGPTILECQVDYVVDAIRKLQSQGVVRIEATRPAQDGWCEMISAVAERTLYPLTESWWTASYSPSAARAEGDPKDQDRGVQNGEEGKGGEEENKTKTDCKKNRVQILAYLLGIPEYERQIRETLDNGWAGYDVVTA